MANLKSFFKENIWVLIIVLSIPAVWALFVPGYFGASDDMHIAWLYEFHKTLTIGQIPPRFVPDLSFGFGYPLFNFAFPLPFYTGEVFHLLGLSFVDSIKAVFFLSVPLSGLFMYLLLRQFLKKDLSLAGALLYIYTPYRAVDLYIRGAIGEIVSFIFFPLIILSVIKISQKNNAWIGIGSISLACLILSHNISAYLFFSFAVIFILLQLFFVNQKRKYLLKTFLMIILGLFISIFFWLPALLESSLMKYDTVFNFVDHFPTISQLFTPYWGYGASVPGPGDGMSFFLGLANILVMILGITFFLIKWKQTSVQVKVVIGWVLSVVFIAIFFMNYRSIFIWNRIPLLPYFQFPWRFLILTTFFIPMLLIIFREIKFKYLSIALLLLIIPTAFYFRPQDFLGRRDNYYLNRYIPVPSASKEYRQTQEEYLRLPKYTKIRPESNYPLAYSDAGAIESIKKKNDLHTEIEVTSEKGMVLNYSKYYFPGWQAKLNGQNFPIQIGEPYGQISLSIPPGDHRIEVLFKETNFRKVLNAISLTSFLVSLLMVKNLWTGLKRIGCFS